MPKLTHEQFDEKVAGLAATYEALDQMDFSPSGLTNGEVANNVSYGGGSLYPLGTDFARGVADALRHLRFDLGCWGRLTHNSGLFLDEVGEEERLEMAGVLAMMTAPQDIEKFDEVALTLYELLDNVAEGNHVVVERPGKTKLIDGEWKADKQESGQHAGKVSVRFENGHISSRVISIWSDRPENIHADTPDEKGFHHRIAFPMLTLDLEELARGDLLITYPPTEEAVA